MYCVEITKIYYSIIIIIVNTSFTFVNLRYGREKCLNNAYHCCLENTSITSYLVHYLLKKLTFCIDKIMNTYFTFINYVSQ